MKKQKPFIQPLTFILVLAIAAIFSRPAFATEIGGGTTTIHNVKIQYSQLLTPVDNHGVPYWFAIIGGHVDFSGPTPVYVTIGTGGQRYTQPTDVNGDFSFLVYTGGDNQFVADAWTSNSDQHVHPENGTQLTFKK